MRTQPDTAQQLELAIEIANACHPESLTAADTQLGQLRATIAVVLAMQNLAAEVRETRAELANALLVASSQRWPQPVVQLAPNQVEVREVTRPDRGPLTLAILALAGTIVLLLVLCIVLALS